MTTQRVPPVMDRLITRNIMGPSPGRDPFNQPLPGEITTVELWAARRDFRAGDFLQTSDVGLLNINDVRFVVRVDSGPWSAGDILVDDDGHNRSVQGVAKLGRSHLELLARRIGT